MQRSYAAYAMSVIVGRALPDSRDGFKPGQRRILYAMYDTGNNFDKPYRKSARVVGEVMGKYHPHGDSSIYSALVRMAQSFSLRETLVDGHGNFGSVDGDAAASMRYTEARLTKLAGACMMPDIDKDTVEFQENYDGSEMEPKVIPSRFPNLLVNGASGIAVGMATNIPTFNLGEVLDACCEYIDSDGAMQVEDMLSHIPGPDFPTGGVILGIDKIRKALTTGQGSLTIRGKAEVEQAPGDRERIIIHELPYQVNKSELLKSIEALVRNKDIVGISDIRDESNKLGIRVVIETKRDADPNVILNQLFKSTQLERSFGVNMVALKDGQPALMNCLEVIAEFIKFREEVITRRTAFLLKKARARSSTLIALLISIENIDAIVSLIKASKDKAESKEKLMSQLWNASKSEDIIRKIDDKIEIYEGIKIKLTDEQSNAILEMKLNKLSHLESSKITDELELIITEIEEYLKILTQKSHLFDIMKKEFVEVKEKFASPRKTEISNDASDIADEDFIQKEDVVVSITKAGYIKRTPLDIYREQKRGGRGKSVMSTYSDDVVRDVIVTTTHHNILFFSDKGKVYRLKVYKIPQGTTQSKGRSLVNLIPVGSDEHITNILEMSKDMFAPKSRGKDLAEAEGASDPAKAIEGEGSNVGPQAEEESYLFFVTAKGNGRRNMLNDFSNIPTNGKIAIKLEDDRLIGVALCKKDSHIMLSTKHGKAIRFPVDQVRIFMGRTSSGVRAIKLLNGDEVVSLAVIGDMKFSNEVRDVYIKIPAPERIKLNEKLKHDEEGGEGARKMAEKLLKKYLEGEEVSISVDELIELCSREQFVLSITEQGYGKRTSIFEHRIVGRGGQGVSSVSVTKRSGDVVSCFPVEHEDSIMVMSDKGCMIRTSVSSIRMTGRGAVGVKVIDLKNEDDVVTSVTKIAEEVQVDKEGSE